MITTVIFDVGNVLLRWDPRNLYSKIFPSPQEMEHFLTTVCSNEWNQGQDRGRPWNEALAEATALHPGYEAEILAYRSRWHEMLVGDIADNVSLLNTLRRNRVPNYAITNFAADTFTESQERFSFLKQFDGLVCSGVERECKPEPRLFQILLERYQLDPNVCVLIDDSAANVATARSLGFATVHYTLGLDARACLRQLGLPVD